MTAVKFTVFAFIYYSENKKVCQYKKHGIRTVFFVPYLVVANSLTVTVILPLEAPTVS